MILMVRPAVKERMIQLVKARMILMAKAKMILMAKARMTPMVKARIVLTEKGRRTRMAKGKMIPKEKDAVKVKHMVKEERITTERKATRHIEICPLRCRPCLGLSLHFAEAVALQVDLRSLYVVQ